MKKNLNSTKNSRRNFVKKTSLLATGISIVPRHVLGGSGFTAPSDKLVIAGIGIGGKGEEDIANLAKSGKANIAYL
ncbi:MAG TPA: gfo/Idh/MocA family oxidoreductase, partial [Pricia sp.]|nr:gfo/Idh/MocA family oxidoreductase [Pricia sp.]